MAISAKQISLSEKKRNEAKKEYYKCLLEQFCRKIKNSSELGHRHSILTVPTFMVGFPKYDLTQTVIYMCRQLQRLGYRVDMVGPLDIKVQWSKQVEQEPDFVPDLPNLVNLQKLAQKVRSSNNRK